MLDKLPPVFIKICIICGLLFSPITVFTWLIFDYRVALYVLIAWVMLFVIFYMIAVRKYVWAKPSDQDSHPQP